MPEGREDEVGRLERLSNALVICAHRLMPPRFVKQLALSEQPTGTGVASTSLTGLLGLLSAKAPIKLLHSLSPPPTDRRCLEGFRQSMTNVSKCWCFITNGLMQWQDYYRPGTRVIVTTSGIIVLGQGLTSETHTPFVPLKSAGTAPGTSETYSTALAPCIST